jgi:hypothetical protein
MAKLSNELQCSLTVLGVLAIIYYTVHGLLESHLMVAVN